MTALQMFRKGMIRPGCLIKCVKNVGVDKTHRIFVKGRPYRVILIFLGGMTLKAEGGHFTIIWMPKLFKKNLVSPSWTNFRSVKD